jgi:uncharacterized protein
MSHLTPKEKEALSLFKEKLLQAFPDQVDQVKLFGSKARGESSKMSDIDVMVVLKSGDWRTHEPLQRISTQIMIETDIDLSLHIFNVEQLKRMREFNSPFLRHVESEGVNI